MNNTSWTNIYTISTYGNFHSLLTILTKINKTSWTYSIHRYTYILTYLHTVMFKVDKTSWTYSMPRCIHTYLQKVILKVDNTSWTYSIEYYMSRK